MERKLNRIFWKDTREVSGTRLEHDGIPFVILGTKLLECRHGPDRNKALKAKKLAEKEV